MNRFSRLLTITFVALLTACNNTNQPSETDNLFAFKEYISSNTYGAQSIATPIRIDLTRPVTQFEVAQELPLEYIKISPKVKGLLTLENPQTLVFTPAEYLDPDTEYAVTVRLDKLYDDIDQQYRKYTFSFKTIRPNFVLNMENLQSHSKQWQYVDGTIETSDLISLEKAKQLIAASQDGNNNMRIRWISENTDARFFNFTIDSIQRTINDSEVKIKWDGKSINASENAGEDTLLIPGQNNFTVVDVQTTMAPQASLSINFSDPIHTEQDFAGLITMEDAEDLRFEVDRNVLHVYPSQQVIGTKRITLFNGIKNDEGFSLKNEFSELISFEPLKPAVKLLSKGVILPNAANTPLYFETVNLNAVEVRVIRIYEDNMLQFLQNNNLNSNSSYDVKRVGRRVAKKTIDLKKGAVGTMSQWKAHALNLSEMFKVAPGSMYRVEFSFKPEHVAYDCIGMVQSTTNTEDDYYEEDAYDIASTANEDTTEEEREQRYWDNEMYRWRTYSYNWQERDNPCHPAYYNEDRVVSTNVLGSDLGVIVKKGTNNSYHFAVTNLLTTDPESNVKIDLFNFQQQLVETISTQRDGLVLYDSERTISFAIARKGGNYTYVKLEDGNALSYSNFDVSGELLEKGLKGFIYTERGVHRPGDLIHLTFVLDDAANKLPANHPVTIDVTDARGKLVERTVMRGDGNKASGGFYYFPIQTQANAPAGNWNATITVGGVTFSKSLKVATIKPNRLKIKLDFDDEILDASKPVTGKAIASWLHGAPARNLRAEMSTTLRAANTAFKKYPNYVFSDPIRSFSEIEIPVFDTALSAEGQTAFSEKIDLSQKAPGMLKATFLTKVYEGGGDFSIDVFSKELAPFSHFVGLRSPEAHRYGSYFTDENVTFDVASVDAQGTPAANRNLEVKVFKIEWRWWWNRGNDNLSRYEDATVHRPVSSYNVTTNSQGKGTFKVNIPEVEGGRYLIRVIDSESGHATGRITYFYRNWSQAPTDGNSESTKMLVFSSDKENYNVGEEAKITFPSGSEGRALVSIENGTEVLQTQWIETTKGETSTTIQLTEEMAPNVFVNISLLQPHEQTKNDLPIRMYGVIPIAVENPSTILKPKLELPKVLEPEQTFVVGVSEENNQPMTYTIAIVDEGLLDLTRFATPKIHDAFYTAEALGVKTFDMYDFVIGAYSGNVNNIYAIGGGDEAAGAKNRKADRFKPVVTYLGPFTLKQGETAQHQITMPNYVGSVRTMLVAGDKTKSAYGSTDETIPVRKPLMVLASLPRVVAPGEKITLPVTVFAMEKKIKNAVIKVKTSNGFQALGTTSSTISFDEPGEKIVNFDFEVGSSNEVQTVEIVATGNGESASYEVEIDIENPNPITQTTQQYVLDPNKSESISFDTFGVAGTNEAMLEFSAVPPMNFGKRLEYLIKYPHGCIEQTTSGAFPQLFVADVFDVTVDKKQQMQQHIKSAIKRLANFQTSSGGLSYWPGEPNADAWGTNYAGHFMLEAKAKGYALPISFLSNWLRFQKKEARQWRNSRTGYNASLTQAYRLYTLALAGQPELAAMNRLRESNTLSNDGKWRLAAAYALAGKKEVAVQLMQRANVNFVPYEYDYHTYGSPFRNKAMALETMVIAENPLQREVAISLAKELSSKNWYSTQETAYGLLAMAKMIQKNGGKELDLSITQQGSEKKVASNRSVAQRTIEVSNGNNSLTVKNNKENVIYVTLIQKGKLPLGKELADRKNLSISARYLDSEGKPIDIRKVRQGTEIIATVTVTNTSNDYADNIALTKIFPGGWEIVNTSFTDLAGGATGKARYTDIRDDRVNFYFDLQRNKSKTFKVKLNASYLGTYYLPGTQVEAMYDATYYARNQGIWVEVIQ